MIALIRGLYWTGAVTPVRAVPQVVTPHWQRRAITWRSVTCTVIGGRSNTCRRSTPTCGASVRSAQPAPEVVARRVRMELAEQTEIDPGVRDRVIDMVVAETLPSNQE